MCCGRVVSRFCFCDISLFSFAFVFCCCFLSYPSFVFLFFFNDTATTEIYTLSLHDALPISRRRRSPLAVGWLRHATRSVARWRDRRRGRGGLRADTSSAGRTMVVRLVAATGGSSPESLVCTECRDRKSTRLNSSHLGISYAV